MIKLFDVNLPQITKWELKERIVNLDPNKKHSLYWLYSEFLLRANRNAWYKKVLNEATITAIDGKGLHWAMYKAMSNDLIPSMYSNKLVELPTILRIPCFLILFFIKLILNIFDGLFNLVFLKKNFTVKTLNETILGRDFTYEILKICNIKKYKTMIIGGSNEDDTVSKELIQKIYPDIDLVLWTRKTNSLLMQDSLTNTNNDKKPYLTTSNLYEQFPELIEARKAIIDTKPDVVLICIGGASGKQEFFIHDLMNDSQCQFILATGLGAAIDHLGGGAKQTLPPTWSQKYGLEWLWRFIDQPYRRIRIIDSIFTLYWWTTLYQFTKDILHKNYVSINKVTNSSGEILLSKEKTLLPNELGYTMPYSYIQKNQSIEEAGIKYLNRDYKLELSPTSIITIPEKGRQVQLPVSLFIFLQNNCRNTSNQYFVNFFDYRLTKEVTNPKYCIDSQFFPMTDYFKIVNPDKIQFQNLV
jgi:exopolysaccharide biosynthesis WecB/TagA/CpsF family protein